MRGKNVVKNWEARLGPPSTQMRKNRLNNECVCVFSTANVLQVATETLIIYRARALKNTVLMRASVCFSFALRMLL